MTKTTKLLLAASLITFVVGFTDLGWGVGKPLSAVLFGLFLISKILAKESALYGQELRRSLALAETINSRPNASCSKKANQAPPGRLTTVQVG